MRYLSFLAVLTAASIIAPSVSAATVIGSIQPTTAVVNSTVNITVPYTDGDSPTASCGLYVNNAYAGPMTLNGVQAGRLQTFGATGAMPLQVICYDANGTSSQQQGTITITSTLPPNGVSPSASRITVSTHLLVADGTSSGTVTVTLRNASGATLPNINVTLSSSRGQQDTITPTTAITDANGQALFHITSGTLGIGYYTAIAGNVQLSDAPTITYISPGLLGSGRAGPGNLMKLACPDGARINDPCKAVYYYGGDGKRHAFPNEKVYFTWFSDFSGVLEVTDAFMASIPLGRNVTHRPGIRMVKFASLPKTYAVSRGGTLRWVKTEALARTLYGADWNKKVYDVSEAFYTDYKFGTDITTATDYVPSVEAALAQTIDANF